MSATEGNSSDPRSATAKNDISMETPPSSPPPFSLELRGSDSGDGPPALTDIVSQSLSLSPEPSADNTGQHGHRAGRTICIAPSSPAKAHNNVAASSPPHCSTPGRAGTGGGGCRVGGAPVSELTPVISNSGGYVDMLLPMSSHDMGTSRPVPALPARETGSRLSGTRGGLPRPRTGLPPPAKKRGDNNVVRARNETSGRGGGVVTSLSTVENTTSASRGGGGIEKSPTSNASFDGKSSSEGGTTDDNLARLLGERLSMPSYSDDGSSCTETGDNGPPGGASSDAVGARPSVFKLGAARNSGAGTSNFKNEGRSIFENQELAKNGENNRFLEIKNDELPGLAPVELTPDRKFFSFQGARQYHGRPSAAAAARTEMVKPTVLEEERGQYQPPSRGQHGVKEMADAEDLSAIFKAPRKDAHAAASARVVTPSASPSRIDIRPSQSHRQSSPRAAGDLLSRPYPVIERDWSIPSIRLANHVGSRTNSNLNNNGHPLDSFASYAGCSEYTDDDESFYSFLEDDASLDASLSSRGSVDASARRRRRISGIFQLQRKASSEGSGVLVGPSILPPSRSANDAAPDGVSLPPALSRRAETFDSEAPPPPVLDIFSALVAADDAADEYSRPRRHHRSAGREGRPDRERARRKKKKEEGAASAAAEWLRELQDRSVQGVSATSESGRGDYLIAEAASSKFLGAGGVGREGSRSPPPSITTEEATRKALGMPHPLCRSSTIEPGPFARRAGGAFGSRNTGVALGSNSSIALTSSGSGD